MMKSAYTADLKVMQQKRVRQACFCWTIMVFICSTVTYYFIRFLSNTRHLCDWLGLWCYHHSM